MNPVLFNLNMLQELAAQKSVDLEFHYRPSPDPRMVDGAFTFKIGEESFHGWGRLTEEILHRMVVHFMARERAKEMVDNGTR